MMLFIHTIDKVLAAQKTQTRRLFKAGDYGWMCGYSNEINPITGRTGFIYSSVSNQQGEKIINRWQVGKTYAIQPGRGMKAVGRIEIVSIRREDVRNISDADVIAEGFEWRSEFLKTWARMHDKSFYEMVHRYEDRPAERYQAWVLEFKLVKAS